MRRIIKDKDVELIMGDLLRTGVILSSIIVFIGGIIYLINHGGEQPDYKTFHGMLLPFHSLPEIFRGILEFRGRALIQAGVLLLIATPIARVVFSIYAFAREGDRLYVFLTSLVLGIIILSMLSGFGA